MRYRPYYMCSLLSYVTAAIFMIANGLSYEHLPWIGFGSFWLAMGYINSRKEEN